MFSLIITIISIALVTALALATIYYGGSAFRQGADAARAATLVNGSQQIVGAYQFYQATTGVAPTSTAQLISSGALASAPGRLYLLETITGTDGPYVTEGDGMTGVDGLPLEVCQALDKVAGRTPSVDGSDYPVSGEVASHPSKFGCVRDEGLWYYFKV